MVVVVTGANGRIGSEVVRLLSAQGESVRALVRDPAQAVKLPGVAWFQGDLGDPNTLHPIMARADSLFLIVPNTKGMLAFSHNALVAAEEEGVSYVVKVTSLGTSPHSSSSIDRWHHEGESELRNSTMSWTVLRAHSFMQNFLDLAPEILRTGKLCSAAGAAQVPFIDCRDVALVGARVLTEPGYEGERFVLTGPAAIGYADVARMIGEVAGRPIQYVSETPEQARARLTREGQGPDVIEDWLAIAEYQRAGGPAAIPTPAVHDITSHTPRSFPQFLADHRSAFAARPAA
jgi:uncharacterized protein YbjT (DUF2867 family)